MKIDQIPIGSRFEFKGQVLVKTGPMLGTAADGTKHLVPRYAVLVPLDPDAEPKVRKEPATVERFAVLEAFERFYFACHDLVADEHLQALDTARAEFLECLKP